MQYKRSSPKSPFLSHTTATLPYLSPPQPQRTKKKKQQEKTKAAEGSHKPWSPQLYSEHFLCRQQPRIGGKQCFNTVDAIEKVRQLCQFN